MISGAGGGLGHIAVQLSSRGMAHRVIGIDDGSKRKLVMDCGALHFIDVKEHNDESIAAEVVKLTGGLGASAVIVCTSNNRAYGQAIDFLRFGGTLVCVGMPGRTTHLLYEAPRNIVHLSPGPSTDMTYEPL